MTPTPKPPIDKPTPSQYVSRRVRLQAVVFLALVLLPVLLYVLAQAGYDHLLWLGLAAMVAIMVALVVQK